MVLNTIEKEWQGFSAMVFAKMPHVSEVQRKEMKKAFFAGAWTMFVMFEQTGTDEYTEAQALTQIGCLRDECEEFQKAIIREYAETN